MESEDFLSWFSFVIGWIYFVCWSVSFYPQIWLNWQRKSCRGLSVDFLLFNIWGFICYAIYNSAFYFSEEIRAQYRRRHNDQDNIVRLNDVLFVYHVLILSLIIIGQAIYYKTHRHQSTSTSALYICLASILVAVVFTVACLTGYAEWLDLLYTLSFVKLAATIFKCTPQLYMNYKLKSTVAWSIGNVLLDFVGSVLSMLQLFLDAYRLNNWSGVWGNPIKLGLGFFSLVLDIVFLVQHYVLYPRSTSYSELAELMTDEEDHCLDISVVDDDEYDGRTLIKPN